MKKSICVISLLSLLLSCGQKSPVTTGSSTAEQGTLSLSGTVDTKYLTTLKNVGFFISTSEDFPSDITQEYVSSEVNGDGSFLAVVKGLRPSTTYYYKAFVRMDATSLVGKTCSIVTEAFSEPMHAVDLGLSVKWCSCNLGATYPEEFGDYYVWGATSVYSPDVYERSPGGGRGPKYDIASIRLGDDWRMPSDSEWNELIQECSWTWTSQNGIDGYLVTSKTNGNSIFLPAAGFWKEKDLVDVGKGGVYWSSIPDPEYIGDNDDARYPPYIFRVNFDSKGVYQGSSPFSQGRSIRPVCGQAADAVNAAKQLQKLESERQAEKEWAAAEARVKEKKKSSEVGTVEEKTESAYQAECRKYGKKYVDRARNYQIDIGMPEELFLKYFSKKRTETRGLAIAVFTLEQVHKSSRRSDYRLNVHVEDIFEDAEVDNGLYIVFQNGKLESYDTY